MAPVGVRDAPAAYSGGEKLSDAALQYSKSQINKAGLAIRDARSWSPELDWAFDAVGSWRSFHAYPLRVALLRLEFDAKNMDKLAMVSERLKRLDAIHLKLRRAENHQMKLSTMQDIAGCRAVVNSVKDARDLASTYPKLAHDYISTPKPDGYRGLHIVERYEPRGDEDERYRGCRIEIQIRSRVQHGWAAALETFDFVRDEKLKLGGGDQDWRRFFVLAASAIALTEDSPPVLGAPHTEKQLANDLREATEKLNALEVLRGLHLGVYSAKRANIEAIAEGGEVAGYLVTLDMRDHQNITTRARAYAEEELDQIEKEYIEIEKEYFGDPKRQILKLSVDKVENLQPAYPAYFLDAQIFSIALEGFIRR
jgi:putative GTP pyrophosphokinase